MSSDGATSRGGFRRVVGYGLLVATTALLTGSVMAHSTFWRSEYETLVLRNQQVASDLGYAISSTANSDGPPDATCTSQSKTHYSCVAYDDVGGPWREYDVRLVAGELRALAVRGDAVAFPREVTGWAGDDFNVFG